MIRFALKPISWPALVAAIGLLAACQTPFLPASGDKNAGTGSTVTSERPEDRITTYSGPTGETTMTVRVPEAKLQSAQRRVQSVDFTPATAVNVFVTGAGINGWVMVKEAALFGAPDANGVRTATFSTNIVPAGPRRVFRVDIRYSWWNTAPNPDRWEHEKLYEELWGVADITAGGTTTVDITRFTTPVAKIFRTLLLSGNAGKAITLPVSDIQTFVDQLLNTDHTTGNALDGTQPQINYSILHTDMAANAIINGVGGVPYTVPPAPPASLVPTPVRKGALTVETVDVLGQPVTNESVIILDDYATPIGHTTPGATATITFDAVTPGSWSGKVVDLTTGRSQTYSAVLGPGQSKSMKVTLTPQTIERYVGAYNLTDNMNYGFNEDGLNPAITLLDDPAAVAVNNSVLYWVDRDNKRIRSVSLTSNEPAVKTVAGNGTQAAAMAPEGSVAALAPIDVTGATVLGFDENGDLLFSEPTLGRIARVNLANGQLTTVLNLNTTPGIGALNASEKVPAFAYHKATRKLYVFGDYYNCGCGSGIRWDLFSYDLNTSTLSLVRDNYEPASIITDANHIYYTFKSSSAARIIRRHVTTGAEVTLVGLNNVYDTGEGVPAPDYYKPNQDIGWGNWAVTRYYKLAIDGAGNLLFEHRHHYGSDIRYQKMKRVTKASQGDQATNDWYINTIDVVPTGIAVDTSVTPNNIYFSGLGKVPNPSGAGNIDVHAINVLKP